MFTHNTKFGAVTLLYL